VGCGVNHVSGIEEWNMLKDLHIKYVFFSVSLLWEHVSQFHLTVTCLLPIQDSE
jgi:hypothetical protein